MMLIILWIGVVMNVSSLIVNTVVYRREQRHWASRKEEYQAALALLAIAARVPGAANPALAQDCEAYFTKHHIELTVTVDAVSVPGSDQVH